MVFVEKGRQLMSVAADGKFQLWDAATGMLLAERVFAVNQSVISPAVPIAFSADGSQLAGRSEADPRIVRCWNTSTGAEIRTLPEHAFPVCCVRFSPDARYLATSAFAPPTGTQAVHEIKIWDNRTGKLLATMAGKGRIFNLVFAPDSSVLAWSGQEGRINLWQWESEKESITIVGHQGDVTGIAFSSDGELLSSAGLQDRRVKVWKVASLLTGDFKELHVMAAPSLVCDLAFSPDNRRLAAISRDKVRIWDVGTGHEALTLRAPSALPRSSFQPAHHLQRGRHAARRDELG